MKRVVTRSKAEDKERAKDKPEISRLPIARPGAASETTLAQQAYERLRTDILDGVFGAGKPLRLEALKGRYNLSFSPLREALNRLQSDRLVVASALRGFRVAELSIAQMWDSIETRILIEGEALSRAIARGGDDWEASIIGAFHALSRCAERVGASERRVKREEDELERRHRDFHASLISACGSNWLIEFSTLLYEQTERYRRPLLGSSFRAWWTKRDIRGEHQAIMKSVLNRNAKSAVQLLSEHYRKTGQIIERSLEKAA
jgi:DNA-binding GntR family transcriptional regulator